MAMEDVLRIRKSVRAAFTKTVNNLMEEFEKEALNGEVVKTKFLTLDRIYSELKDCHEIILKNIGTDEEFEKEYNKIEEYRDKMDLVRVKNESFLNKMCSDRTAESINSSPKEKRKMRLPKIELLHFGGELNDYLGFWSQFQRIHTDQDLALEDKFQYLLQCMVQGSRTHEVIESFPPTSENFEKAVEALKNRFGRGLID
ncbi:pro-Pol polyprotein [Trichonephila clavipes]|nr:pro-Pol polyprotein [Trichonephila clavipes]